METLIKEGKKNEKTHRIVCRFLCCLRFLRRLVNSLFQFYEEVNELTITTSCVIATGEEV